MISLKEKIMRILVIEDEIDLNDIICKQLRLSNYTVDCAYNGSDALDFILSFTYNVIISDVSMPKMDGFEFLKKIRNSGNLTPVIFLSARGDISDKISGLDAGASDYIVKPFLFDELLARIRVATRSEIGLSNNLLTCYDLVLDVSKCIVKRGDTIINLTSKEFSILKYLLINKNIVLSREKIENAIWNYDYDGYSNMVDVYIRYLRRKIDSDNDLKIISTVRGIGYAIFEDEK